MPSYSDKNQHIFKENVGLHKKTELNSFNLSDLNTQALNIIKLCPKTTPKHLTTKHVLQVFSNWRERKREKKKNSLPKAASHHNSFYQKFFKRREKGRLSVLPLSLLSTPVFKHLTLNKTISTMITSQMNPLSSKK